VAPVGGDGRELVLKVGWWHTEAAHEADGLRLWNGDGAVLLHGQHVAGNTSALLLERCAPGSLLAEVLPEPEQDVVVAGLLRRLWREPPDGHPFRPLQLMCDEWATEFEEKLAAAPGAVDPGLARAAMELFRGLPSTASRAVVLCTDLHAENILAAEREPWLVIDPKPYVGDPAYDPLQHMLNCSERLARDPHGFVRRMADLLDLDADRLTRWLFARCVQESIDAPDLRDVAALLDPA
jgi:streptomycin 6-kinase